MKLSKSLAVSAATIAMTAVLGGAALAQETTSSVRGFVTDEAGAPLTGAVVVITNPQTGFSRTARTDASGSFAVRNLPVGAGYEVTASAGGYQGEKIEGLTLNLGESSNLAFDLATIGGGDEIIIVGTRSVAQDLALGPNSAFDLDTIDTVPNANRDIKDVIRLDPRVFVDPTFADAVQCAGASPRFNSLTVDGVRLNDAFGLNSNGYPTERLPFSYDAIKQVSVELAPFDVQYGGFTACNINAVTKSGTNEIHGGVFVDYTSDSLRGDRTDGILRDNGEYDEYRYGINVGGPIIQDKLFFFAAYEKFKGANLFGRTPTDAGITQADYDQVISIATNQYGYVAGGLPSSIDVEDEKLLVKIDWNISDNHRAAFTYNYNDGFNFSESDGGSTQISDGNHYYERGAELNSYAASVYSDWTENFSTELRASYLKLDNRQIPVAGTDFGEVQVRVGSTTVYLGADDSRHANDLNYDVTSYKAKADYVMGNHTLSAGYEREETSVFNLFIQEVQGEWVFNSIADFAAGDFSDFRYENATTNNQDDGAASFGFTIDTLYAQDEWRPNSDLTVVAGVRVDMYGSDDRPSTNANFQSTYGFPNSDNLQGKSLVQPRFAVTYDLSDDITLRGGFGLYSGGNPNVWISNNYSNNGVTLFECRVRGRSSDCIGGGTSTNVADFTYGGGSGSVFFDVPDEAVAAVAAAQGQGPVNALDPDFEVPSEWKFALGASFNLDTNSFLGNGYEVNTDILYSKTNEAAIVVPLGYTQTGTAPDGRPIYGGNTSDFLLTNAEEKGQSLVLSTSVYKEYDNGLDWTLAYAYTDAKDANPMTSSVAFSNFANFATNDPVNVRTATSDYETPHRFNLVVNYKKEFFQDLESKFSVFATTWEGAPYSYTFARNSNFESPFSSSRQLAYIPTGFNDPLIAATSDPTALNDLLTYIAGNEDLADYRGDSAPRNAFHDGWSTLIDFKFEQEFPGIRPEDNASAFIVVKNVGNMLNDEWGIVRQHGFPGTAELYGASIVNGQYQVNSFNSNADNESISVGASLWEIRVGAKYKF